MSSQSFTLKSTCALCARSRPTIWQTTPSICSVSTSAKIAQFLTDCELNARGAPHLRFPSAFGVFAACAAPPTLTPMAPLTRTSPHRRSAEPTGRRRADVPTCCPTVPLTRPHAPACLRPPLPGAQRPPPRATVASPTPPRARLRRLNSIVAHHLVCGS